MDKAETDMPTKHSVPKTRTAAVTEHHRTGRHTRGGTDERREEVRGREIKENA
jgi:hypothetical protein